jgi:hypothetical protein
MMFMLQALAAQVRQVSLAGVLDQAEALESVEQVFEFGYRGKQVSPGDGTIQADEGADGAIADPLK